jgi:hypothetical protein
MHRTSSRALAVSRPVIRGLIVLNWLYALSLGVLLVASFYRAGWPEAPLGIDPATMNPLAPAGLRTVMALGLAVAAIVHTILRRLLAIVDTVRNGDPFVEDNARRLGLIAWSVLALEILRLVVGAIATLWEPGHGPGFTPAPWLAVLLLFVLSGVFAHGARMRADLDGTV